MEDIKSSHLVNEAKKGNRQALRMLIERHQDELYRFLLFLCSNPDLASDLTQETLIRALEGIHKLKDNSKFKSWLKITAKNLFLDHMKSANVKYNQTAERIEDVEEQNKDLTEPDLDLTIKQTLAQMTKESRLVLLLVDLEGHSYIEASEILSISEQALRSRLHRARQEFQDIYTQFETNPKSGSSFNKRNKK